MRFPSLISRFSRSKVDSGQRLLFRFGMACVVGVALLGGLLWRKNVHLQTQQEAADVLPLTAAVLNELNQVALRLQTILAETSVQRRAGLVADLDWRIVSLRARVQELVDMSDRLGGREKAGFASLFLYGRSGLRDQLDRYLADVASVKEKILQNQLDANAKRTATQAIGHLTIIPQIESVRAELIARNLRLLKQARQMNLGSFLFVVVLFLAMAIFIVFPARHLIEAQVREREVTSRSLAERDAELALSEMEVGAQKRILQYVLDHIGEAVVVFNSGGGLLLQNAAATSLFQNIELGTNLENWEKAVVLHDAESFLPLSPDEMPARVALRGGIFSSRLVEIRSSLRIGPLFVRAAGYPLLDENGGVRGAMSCFHDVTENVQREMDLRKAKSAAEDASKSKTEFLANISHEIRTPMTTILGYADILMGQSVSSQDLRRSVETIRRNGKVLMTLIDDILDVSRIESGRLHIEKANVSLEEVLSELHSLLSSRAEEKKIGFRIAAEGKVPKRIHTATVRLRQILINLAGNAIKFTEKGEVAISVRLEREAWEEKSRLVFVVSDTGCGIPHDVIQSLFAPFVQVDTKANRLYGGSGLGLTLSRRLAAALGGDVRLVNTQVGVGSSFLIEIDPGPIDSSDLTDNIAVKKFFFPPSPVELIENDMLKGTKLLLVDDSVENLALFAYFLEAAGATVTKATGGQGALDCALTGEFDLILLDIQMPRMDGYQTIAKLRAMEHSGPVVALTAHAMESEAISCKAAGFDSFLNKPIDGLALVEGVRSAVRQFQGRTEEELPGPGLPFRRQGVAASEKVINIISKFVNNIPGEVDGIRAACEVRNWDEVVKNTHRFRGTAGSCGFMELMDEISRLEDAVLAGNTESNVISGRIRKLQAVGDSSIREFRTIKVWES
jgi:signal transduction histidine kinase/CheY-like chemotaxis protein/HPt (histidine-containing phosphotransfer) domain-containing protein